MMDEIKKYSVACIMLSLLVVLLLPVTFASTFGDSYSIPIAHTYYPDSSEEKKIDSFQQFPLHGMKEEKQSKVLPMSAYNSMQSDSSYYSKERSKLYECKRVYRYADRNHEMSVFRGNLNGESRERTCMKRNPVMTNTWLRTQEGATRGYELNARERELTELGFLYWGKNN